MAEPRSGPGLGSDGHSTPRWVKVSWAIALVLVLLFVLLMLTRGPGGHGPGRHMPSGDAGQTLPEGSR